MPGSRVFAHVSSKKYVLMIAKVTCIIENRYSSVIIVHISLLAQSRFWEEIRHCLRDFLKKGEKLCSRRYLYDAFPDGLR